MACFLKNAKWIYFVCVVKTHRDICLYKINIDIFAEREGNYNLSNDLISDESKPTFKDIQLSKLKKVRRFIYACVIIGFIA